MAGERLGRPSDSRIEDLLRGLQLHTQLGLLNGEPITRDSLANSLEWDADLNVAVLPALTEEDKRAHGAAVHMFVVHSTFHKPGEQGDRLVPTLSFDERPESYQTRTSNVYGTGFYTANRREAAVRSVNDPERTLGAFLTSKIYKGEVLDARRRLPQELQHLGSMVLTEKVLPKIAGQRRVARHYANKADAFLRGAGYKAVLRPEAPRYRAEKLDYEEAWWYDGMPPMYIQVRTKMQRIGTFEPPVEQPTKPGIIPLYTRGFWQAAVRNARDAKRQGVPLIRR